MTRTRLRLGSGWQAAILFVALVGLVRPDPLVATSSGTFEQLLRELEATEGKSTVDRLPALQALGKCEDPRAGKYLADLFKKGAGRDDTSMLEVLLVVLGDRGDAAALEVVIQNAFTVLPDRRWYAIAEAFRGHLDASAITWLTEKGFSTLPTVPPGAQGVILDLLYAASDARAGVAAERLLGNRKCGPAIQARLVDLLRLHKVEGSEKKIAKMFRYDDAGLQVAVLRALRDLDAESHSKVFYEGLESRHWEVRAIAADIFGGTHDPAVVHAITPLLGDAFTEVQVAAVQALRKIGGRDVVLPLIAALKMAPGRVKDDISDTLMWLIGEDLGPDAIAWETWWKVYGEKAEVKGITREEYDRLREASANSATGTYYGLRVISQYVTFVVDVSGSMEEPYFTDVQGSGESGGERGGTTVEGKKKKKGEKQKQQRRKIEVAREELTRALHSIKNGTQFNLISFDSKFERWQPALMEMSDEIRGSAVEYVAGLEPGGMTNIYDTLVVALEDEKVNTIYFLSDGAPTNGKVTNPDEILKLVGEANQIRKVKIHTIGFHLDPSQRS